jgi:hypothetical protein
MGLTSLRPKKPPALSPAVAMTELDRVRERLRATVEQAARSDLNGLLRKAETYGWDRLLAETTRQQQVDLVKRMATALNDQHQVILAVADAYDSMLAAVGKATNQEIERLKTKRRRVGSVQVQPRPGPSWLTVALAGLGGLWLGKRR